MRPDNKKTILPDGAVLTPVQPRSSITPFLAKGLRDAVQVGIRAYAEKRHTPQRDCAGLAPDFPHDRLRGPCTYSVVANSMRRPDRQCQVSAEENPLVS